MAEGFCHQQEASFKILPIMRRPIPLDDGFRFNAQIRHYHRSGLSQRRTWDEWVDGENAKPGVWIQVLKIAGLVLALLALGAIIAGLVISLR